MEEAKRVNCPLIKKCDEKVSANHRKLICHGVMYAKCTFFSKHVEPSAFQLALKRTRATNKEFYAECEKVGVDVAAVKNMMQVAKRDVFLKHRKLSSVHSGLLEALLSKHLRFHSMSSRRFVALGLSGYCIFCNELSSKTVCPVCEKHHHLILAQCSCGAMSFKVDAKVLCLWEDWIDVKQLILKKRVEEPKWGAGQERSQEILLGYGLLVEKEA